MVDLGGLHPNNLVAPKVLQSSDLVKGCVKSLIELQVNLREFLIPEV